MDTLMSASFSPVSPGRHSPLGGRELSHVPPHFLTSPSDSSDAFQPHCRRLSTPGSSARRGSSASRRRGSLAGTSVSGSSAARSGLAPTPTPDGRQFVCKECNRSFARLLHLQRHEYRHVNYRPFECPCCDKTFSRHDSLVRHARLHKDQLPEGSQAADKLRKHKACMSCTETAKCERCAKFSRRPSKSAKACRKGKAQSQQAQAQGQAFPQDELYGVGAPPNALWSLGSNDEGVAPKLLATGEINSQAKRLPSPLAHSLNQAALPPASSSPASTSFASPFSNVGLKKRDQGLVRVPSNSSLTSARSQGTTWSSRSLASAPTAAMGLDNVPALSPSSHSVYSDDLIPCPPSPATAAAAVTVNGAPQATHAAQVQSKVQPQFNEYQLMPPSMTENRVPLHQPLPPPEMQLQQYAFDSTSIPSAPSASLPGAQGSPGQTPHRPSLSTHMNIVDPATLAEQGVLVDTYMQMQTQMATIRKFMHENMVAFLARRLPPVALEGEPSQAAEMQTCHPPQPQAPHALRQQALLPTPPVQSDPHWGYAPSHVSDSSGTTTTMSMPPLGAPKLETPHSPTVHPTNTLVPGFVGLGLGPSVGEPSDHRTSEQRSDEPLHMDACQSTEPGNVERGMLGQSSDSMAANEYSSITDLLAQAQAFQSQLEQGARGTPLSCPDTEEVQPSNAGDQAPAMLDPNDVYNLDELAS